MTGRLRQPDVAAWQPLRGQLQASVAIPAASTHLPSWYALLSTTHGCTPSPSSSGHRHHSHALNAIVIVVSIHCTVQPMAGVPTRSWTSTIKGLLRPPACIASLHYALRLSDALCLSVTCGAAGLKAQSTRPLWPPGGLICFMVRSPL
jgi:hypothetical protein